MTSIRCWCIVVLLVLCANGYASVQLKKGMSFKQARQRVLADHWQPIRMHSHIAQEGKEGFPFVGQERILSRLGIIELDSCSLGASFCNFYYRRGEECLLLETEGEGIRYMQLVHWEITDCPNPE